MPGPIIGDGISVPVTYDIHRYNMYVSGAPAVERYWGCHVGLLASYVSQITLLILPSYEYDIVPFQHENQTVWHLFITLTIFHVSFMRPLWNLVRSPKFSLTRGSDGRTQKSPTLNRCSPPRPRERVEIGNKVSSKSCGTWNFTSTMPNNFYPWSL